MNKNSLRIAPSGAIEIKGVDDQPLYFGDERKPVRVIVHSPGTHQFATVEARQQDRLVSRMDENMKIVPASAEDRRREAVEDLVDLTIAFEGLEDGDLTGRALFESYYSDPAVGYITKQVTKGLNDWGKFKPGSAIS